MDSPSKTCMAMTMDMPNAPRYTDRRTANASDRLNGMRNCARKMKSVRGGRMDGWRSSVSLGSTAASRRS